ncbi:MAG: VOC family protein [Nitrospirota bacterium]|nr:VOC family protein [Nitrospirota bacterium]
MIRYSGINHAALVTNNMDRTIRFWRDLLGLRLIAGMGKPGERQYFFEVTKGSLISFFEWKGAEPVQDKDAGRPVKGPFAFDHICLELSGEEELWELKDRLQAADLWVSEVLDNGFIYSIFTTDPNNIQLEFCCRVKGVCLPAHPVMTDAAPSSVTREGTGPQPGIWPAVDEPTLPEARKIYPGELKRLVEGNE